jgi:hypothetical protein
VSDHITLPPVPAGNALPVVTKTLVRDLLVQDGFLLEKAEAMAITPLGDYIIANDNDGAGETQIFRFPNTRYDICLEDDDSGDLLRFNSATGEYIFARYGSGAFTLTSRGSIKHSRIYFAVFHRRGRPMCLPRIRSTHNHRADT